MSTKSAILALVRERPRTITELEQALGLSRNAIVVQIAALQAEQLIRPAGTRNQGQKGKPAAYFEAIEGREDAFSGAYQAVSRHLMAAMTRDLPEKQVEALMQALGERLALDLRQKKQGNAPISLDEALDFLDGIGAQPHHMQTGQDMIVTSDFCPIAAMVRENDHACELVAQFFRTACAGVDAVAVGCRRAAKLKCQFHLKLAGAAGA